jgi:hypothetical protein
MSSTKTHTTAGKRKYLTLIYGVLCHGLFALAVVVMIYEMFFGLSRSRGALRITKMAARAAKLGDAAAGLF